MITIRVLAVMGLSAVLATCASPPEGSTPESKSPASVDRDSIPSGPSATQREAGRNAMAEKVVKTDREWREILTPEQYKILRKKGTERAFTGEYWRTKTPGVYTCAGCGQALFDSDHKFDSGTGWPSYWQPIAKDRLTTASDRSWGRVRTEVLCSRCGGHLGHVFTDGPEPTGLRYCINSAALKLAERARNK